MGGDKGRGGGREAFNRGKYVRFDAVRSKSVLVYNFVAAASRKRTRNWGIGW